MRNAVVRNYQVLKFTMQAHIYRNNIGTSVQNNSIHLRMPHHLHQRAFGIRLYQIFQIFPKNSAEFIRPFAADADIENRVLKKLVLNRFFENQIDKNRHIGFGGFVQLHLKNLKEFACYPGVRKQKPFIRISRLPSAVQHLLA